MTLALATVASVLAVRTGEAHKPITSKYTYNDDVFPVVRAKCGRCHVAGGIAPMSLMTYEEAFPWAESIRAELVASHMPPWGAQPGFGSFKHTERLTAEELDILLTWATGGNPRGRPDQQLPQVALGDAWPLGPPDLTIALPAVAVPTDKMEQMEEFTVPTGVTETRWVRAVDLQPGTTSIVRSATIAVIDVDDTPFSPDRVLRRWVPGQDPESLDRDGTAFELPAKAQLLVRVHYKKTWQFEGKSLKDASTIGLYFTNKPAASLLTVPIAEPAGTAPSGQILTFAQSIDREVRALAISPDQIPPNIIIVATAVLPDGTKTPLIRLNTRADWSRRYWFDHPMLLPRGTKIEVVANLDDPNRLALAAFGGPIGPQAPPVTDGLRLSLNVLQARDVRSTP
jgi:hypothetical protein